ncbi:MAG: hypothetical protein ACI4FX_07620 [Agathobacter sp.]
MKKDKILKTLKEAYLKGDVSAVEWLDFVLNHEEDELHQVAMSMPDEELTAFLVWAGDEDWMVADHETRRNPDYYIDLAKRKWDEVLAAEIKEWKAQGYVQSEEDEDTWVLPGTRGEVYPWAEAGEIYESCLTPEEVAGRLLWTRGNKADALKDWTENTDGIQMSVADLEADRILKEICKLTRKEILEGYNVRAMYFVRPDGTDAMVADNGYSLDDCLRLYDEGCNFYFD